MPNYAASLTDLNSYVSARVPVIVVHSVEQSRALRLVDDLARSPHRAQLDFTIYTRATGLRDLRSNAQVNDDKSFTGALDYAAQLFTLRETATMVLLEPDDLSSDSAVTRHLCELARLADRTSGSIIIISDRPIWSGLSRLGMTITLDLPDFDEMYDLIVEVLKDHNGIVPIEWSESDAKRAAGVLVGVTEAEATNMMATVIASGSVAKSDVFELSRKKDAIFGELAGLQRIILKDSDYGVGGLENLRQWLKDRKEIVGKDLRATGLTPPRGVLLVGVPGCGKSLSAKAIAADWQLPLYRLDFAAILGQYVGQSENQLREALETADRVSPCVLWIDEIEKGLAGQNDTTGVGRRLVGQFLFWLQESDSATFVVSTANDVRQLPPELLRKGRFDEIFFVDLPTATERAEIILMYFKKILKTTPDESFLADLVELSEGFAGSDLQAVINDIGMSMFVQKATTCDPEFIRTNFLNCLPLSKTNPEQIDDIRQWGKDRAVPAGRINQTTTTLPLNGRRMVLLDAELTASGS